MVVLLGDDLHFLLLIGTYLVVLKQTGVGVGKNTQYYVRGGKTYFY
jgi:hypothetical protein